MAWATDYQQSLQKNVMIKRLKTLRVRFALWVAGLLLVALSAFGVYVYSSVANGLFAEMDASLQIDAARVADAFDIVPNGTYGTYGTYGLPEGFMQQPESIAWLEPGFTIRILSPAGLVLQTFGLYGAVPDLSANLGATSSMPSLPSFATLTDPSSHTNIRLYSFPVDENNRRAAIVQVMQSLADAQNTLQRLRTSLLVAVPLLAALAGFSGYFLAARALAPIDRMTRTARNISADDLSARLNLPATDDEVGRLSETFDAMLARLDHAFRRERQFTADASHELRTPLAAMQAILSVICEQRRTPADYEHTLADLADEVNRLQTLTESLLQLARIEAGKPTAREPIDLSTLLHDVADSMRPLAEAKALTLVCQVPAGLTLQGDTDDLIRLFVSLLDNAVKYTEQGGISLVASKLHDDSLSVVITDSGIGIAPAHWPHIFERFYRVDQSRVTRGVGLGLALALEIARVHGGNIAVGAGDEGGTRFTALLSQPQSLHNVP